MRIRNPLLMGAVLAGALVSVSMPAQNVSTDYDHDANFAQYHTYSLGKVQASDQLVQQRLSDALNRELSAKGLQRVPSGGDVIVTAVGARQNKQEYTSFYNGLGGGGLGWRRGWGGGGFGQTQTTVQQIPVGTLVVDMYDANNKRLVWRGTASDTLSSKPEKNAEKLNKAVDKLFDKFPPKGK